MTDEKQRKPEPDEAVEGSAELLEDAPVDATPEEAEEAKPPGRELVQAPGEPPYEVLDRWDEVQIIEAIQGRMVRQLLYDFTDAGTRKIDLSWAGVLECCRELAARGARIKVHRDSLQIETSMEDVGNGDEECYVVTVYADEEVTGFGAFGTYVQPKRIKLTEDTAERRRRAKKPVRDDDTIANKFSRQNAVNKAQRNALRTMIPERIRQALISTYKGEDDRVQKILAGAGAEKLQELPPPLEDDEAKGLRAECEALYGELREVSTTIMLPAAYNWMMQRSAGSHELLRAARDDLAARVKEAKEAAA